MEKTSSTCALEWRAANVCCLIFEISSSLFHTPDTPGHHAHDVTPTPIRQPTQLRKAERIAPHLLPKYGPCAALKLGTTWELGFLTAFIKEVQQGQLLVHILHGEALDLHLAPELIGRMVEDAVPVAGEVPVRIGHGEGRA